MLGHALEQDPDDLVLHEAKAFGAAPALAILQQQTLGIRATGGENGLQPLRHRAPEFLFGAGMLVGEPLKVGDDRLLVEQVDGVVARLVGGEHADIRIAKRAHDVTARRTMREKQDHSKGSAKTSQGEFLQSRKPSFRVA